MNLGQENFSSTHLLSHKKVVDKKVVFDCSKSESSVLNF